MKQQEITLLRVMAMFMVVIYHCYCAYAFCDIDPKHWGFGVDFNPCYLHFAKFLHTIDMPAFTLISGYLYAFLRLRCGKYGDRKLFVQKKVKRLLVPYCVWFFIIVLLMPDRGVLSDLFRGIDHLWYLLMLTWCFVTIVITEALWRKLPFAANMVICVFSLSLLYVFMHFNLLTDFLCVESFLAYFPFFFMGVLVVNHDVDGFVEKNISKMVIVVVLAVSLVALFFLTDNNFRFHSDMLARLCGFFISMLLFFLFKKSAFVGKLVSTACVESLNKNSMGIYLLHLVAILFVLEQGWITPLMNEFPVFSPILLFVGVVSLSWLVSLLVNKTKLSFIFG